LDKGLKKSIIVGSTQDPETDQFTYGGCIKRNKWHPFHFSHVIPTQEPQTCDTMNGNCVLIPETVVDLVGLLDPAFSHYAGDFDYGLRAKALGCSVWSAPGYIGTCTSSKTERKKGHGLTIGESLAKLSSQKGLSIQNVDLHPFWEWKRLTQRHGGIFWVFYWLIPYRRIFWQVILDRIKRAEFHE
jgi:GT2 family glycosyltransferase